MITGGAGSFFDIVCMVPLTRINNEVINGWWWKVVESLTMIGFRIVTSISDGHSANRKFVTDNLQCRNGKSHIENPFAAPPFNRIHPLFDTIHLMKGLYTNLLNKGEFECPPFEDQVVRPRLSHFRSLYEEETCAAIRYAPKLNHKVIAPMPIERCNVDLSVRFYHESTAAALRHYSNESETRKEWNETAAFVDIVNRYFKTINVKTTTFAGRKRDEFRKPVCRDDTTQIKFLQNLLTWIEEWEKMPTKKKLSRETFFALKFTLRGIIKLCKYLLVTTDLSYILLGKFNSDPIERRFGNYRQLSGANFFVSLKQILESEKKIRIRSLIKFDKLDAQDLRNLCKDKNEATKKRVEEECELLVSLLNDPESDEAMDLFDLEDRFAIVFYCAGSIARSILLRNKCEKCKFLLLDDKKYSTGEQATNLDDFPSATKELKQNDQFLSLNDRGGLLRPSQVVYATSLFALKLREEIFQDEDLRKIVMSSADPRALFVSCWKKRVESSCHLFQALNQHCDDGHSFHKFVPDIGEKCFNLASKNLATNINNNVHQSRKRGGDSVPSSKARKISKLSGHQK
ncbi:uncharacterized protein LOC131892312 [Tigriopus californicus]|uniref:uncharacterized protein LOC131892312 n=1 Tax=Tigriopus californicus TaxID=6832 RepID=UPI0027DA02CF|nr:uncharacterized protein LOC131892312 [Tigriopus californicus]